MATTSMAGEGVHGMLAKRHQIAAMAQGACGVPAVSSSADPVAHRCPSLLDVQSTSLPAVLLFLAPGLQGQARKQAMFCCWSDAAAAATESVP
ncbi:hypothetical protein BP6252_09085 [Coleophoma cylindrospora]|uniref:Uncharacterized protein n=1 Tax=Coleophoma cylindrospora TaxID=1849047 RepID=A0A3D8R0X6_9HELO|nr:hypothetical protein BP6252_09085 [Coleophoma cylindrospora]